MHLKKCGGDAGNGVHVRSALQSGKNGRMDLSLQVVFWHRRLGFAARRFAAAGIDGPAPEEYET